MNRPYNEIFLKTSKHNNDVIPRRCGYISRAPLGCNIKNARYNYCVIHCCTGGKGYFEYKGKTHIILPGDIFIFPIYEYVSYFCDKDEPWEYYWICFNGRACDRMSSVPDYVTKTKNTALFKEVYEKALNLDAGADYVTSKIYELFSEILPCDDSERNMYSDKAILFIEKHITEKISVGDVASHLGITRDYLSFVFKRSIGESPKAYILRQKLLLASRDIELGMTIECAAEKYGFCDRFQFSKMYKKYMNESPKRIVK